MSTPDTTSTQSWLTVSQAAVVMGISERQARRYAGRLAGHDRQEAGPEAGHVATLVRLSAMQDLRTKAVPRDIRPDMRPDTTPDTSVTKAGREAGHIQTTPDMTPDTDNARLLAERECEFLRDALQRERQNADQWRAQVEAANRDAAELRAALREALKAMPKALTEGETSTRTVVETSRENAPQAPQREPATKEARPVEKSERGPALRDLRTILKTLFGLR